MGAKKPASTVKKVAKTAEAAGAVIGAIAKAGAKALQSKTSQSVETPKVSKTSKAAEQLKVSKASKPVVTPKASKSTKQATLPVSQKKNGKAAVKPDVKAKGSSKKSLTQLDDKYIQSKPADVNEMMRLLCEYYPDADCELEFASPFQLLTAVIMSAQTTDVSVNKVTPVLYSKYPDAKSLAVADLEDVKQIIRATGFFNAKANNIQRCAQALVERFGGEVPQTLEELVTLPGVGRKTANVVLGVAYGQPGWTVDTHVQRLVRRLGFTPETDPEKIEFALQKVFPNQDWSKYSITLIWHGRRLCFARKPDCQSCPINHLCPSSQAPLAR